MSAASGRFGTLGRIVICIRKYWYRYKKWKCITNSSYFPRIKDGFNWIYDFYEFLQCVTKKKLPGCTVLSHCRIAREVFCPTHSHVNEVILCKSEKDKTPLSGITFAVTICTVTFNINFLKIFSLTTVKICTCRRSSLCYPVTTEIVAFWLRLLAGGIGAALGVTSFTAQIRVTMCILFCARRLLVLRPVYVLVDILVDVFVDVIVVGTVGIAATTVRLDDGAHKLQGGAQIFPGRPVHIEEQPSPVDPRFLVVVRWILIGLVEDGDEELMKSPVRRTRSVTLRRDGFARLQVSVLPPNVLS